MNMTYALYANLLMLWSVAVLFWFTVLLFSVANLCGSEPRVQLRSSGSRIRIDDQRIAAQSVNGPEQVAPNEPPVTWMSLVILTKKP